MDDDEEYDEEVDCEELEQETWSHAPTYPWSWRSLGVHIGMYVHNVMGATSVLAKGISGELAAAHNYEVAQRQFRQSVSRDIETIVKGE